MELFFHNLPELVEPYINLFHFVDFKFVIDFPAFLFMGQEIALGQDAQMLRYGLPGNVEVLRNSVRGHRLHGDQDEDRSSGGICNGLKNVSSHNLLPASGSTCEADRLQIYMQPIGFAKFIFIIILLSSNS